MAVLASTLSVLSKIQSGRAAAASGRIQLANARRKANQQRAEGQHQALEDRRQAKILASRAIAVAAAGGSPSDTGTARSIADIQGEGAYRAALSIYQGEEQATKTTTAGEIANFEAGQQRDAAFLDAGATIASGPIGKRARGLFGKYG